MEHKISFVSDMTVSKMELIIAYGAGDAESRTFVVNICHTLTTFSMLKKFVIFDNFVIFMLSNLFKVRDLDHYFSD